MSLSKPAKVRPIKEGRGQYVLRLFVAGDGPNSTLALANLRHLCKERLEGRFKIEIVDVVRNFATAVKNNILITPTLLLVAPLPSVVLLGNLSDRRKVLLALRLPEDVS